MTQRTFIKFILLAFTLLGVLLAQKSAPPQEPWKEYSYPEDGFAITAPSAPDIHKETEAADVQVYTWRVASDIVLSVRTAIRPNCMKTLQEPLPPDAYYPGSLKRLFLDGNLGMEYESPYGTSGHSLQRLYCVKQRAYSLTVAYPESKPRPA
ncbi:MAG TPA: hypothetical protein VJ723_08000, partial [Candidatus Angelobacter sp.]|nr:hypothetical protein [Candidatus Angelobacter sp.]